MNKHQEGLLTCLTVTELRVINGGDPGTEPNPGGGQLPSLPPVKLSETPPPPADAGMYRMPGVVTPPLGAQKPAGSGG